MADDKKVKVELIRGLAGTLPNQRKTVKALGLGKVHSSVTLPDTPVTRGMIRVVEHMVRVEEI